MKPFGKKRDHQVELPTSGLTGRQLTTIAVAFALAIVLVPVGAKAAALINTVITDPGGVNKATVGAEGNLHVSGNVSVANTPSVAASQSGDWSVGLATGTVVGSMPGLPFQKLVAAADLDAIRLFVPITGIPDGKQLLVTHISGDLTCSLDEGQAFADCDLDRIGIDRTVISISDNRRVFAEPIRQASPGFVRYFFNDDCLAVLEPVGDDDPVATAEVNGIAALLQFQMVVSGYLVDA